MFRFNLKIILFKDFKDLLSKIKRRKDVILVMLVLDIVDIDS